MVDIRKMDNGDTVVDFGKEWFRIRPDGSVTKKWGANGHVEVRAATPRERKRIFALADSSQLGNSK